MRSLQKRRWVGPFDEAVEPARDEQHVEIAVAVVIEQPAARAHDFRKVELAGRSVDVLEPQARGRGRLTRGGAIPRKQQRTGTEHTRAGPARRPPGAVTDGPP